MGGAGDTKINYVNQHLSDTCSHQTPLPSIFVLSVAEGPNSFNG
jgi:hypothetical protein